MNYVACRFTSRMYLCQTLFVIALTAAALLPRLSLAQSCTPSPSGLVSWWPAAGNATDIAGANNGTITGGVTFSTGEVGQAFNFSGASGTAVSLGNAASLQLQNFTIEGWIQLLPAVTNVDRVILGYGDQGYIFGVRNTGALFLSKAGTDIVLSSVTLANSSFHHVAVTKNLTTVVFYVDGVAYPAGAYSTTYNFTTTLAIGARGDDLSSRFNGKIDELSVYNRALTATEMQAIFSAGTAGKCVSSAPVILTQPASLTVAPGNNANFNVTATGTAPLKYQWSFNSTIISGATASALALINVQNVNAGNYSVVVSNALGTATSSTAVLTVSAASCTPPPSGLVSWWKGEGNSFDTVSGNNGTNHGNVQYATGKSGQGFSFDGANNEGVSLGNPVSLQLQNFTIEAWIQLASVVSGGDRDILAYGDSGFIFGIQNNGTPFLSKAGTDLITPTYTFSDIALHHLALTKNGSTVIFYVDGVAYPAASEGNTFSFGTTAAIGARGDNLTGNFNGIIDEVSIYNRALSQTELVAIYNSAALGKCPTIPPTVVTSPANQTVLVGSNVNLSVSATGSQPLSYQWQFNSVNISGATTSQLNLINAQLSAAGNYSVVISNPNGSTNSGIGVLTVDPAGCTPPPSGLVSWWQAEGTPADIWGGNHGVVIGALSYAAGEVGQGFNFTGAANNGLNLGAAASLQLQNFTIEAWVKLGATVSSDEAILGFGSSGYIFGLTGGGVLFLTKADVDSVVSSAAVVDTAWHHVAVTKNGSTVVFYVDGTAYPAPSYASVFSFTTPAAIGARGDNYSVNFNGVIDELSVYSRALSIGEIRAVYVAGASGKCISSPPVIGTQPVGRTVAVGGSASFSVAAAGATPFTYQWQFNSVNISGATTSSLILPNVQLANAGNYSVVVNNAIGSTNSTTAVLIVDPAGCVAAPAGLISLWQGESSPFDVVGPNSGTIVGTVNYAAGEVGNAFSFTGTAGSAVNLGNPVSLQLQNFTIEAWVRLTSPTSGGDRVILGYGDKGYIFGVRSTGALFLSKAGTDLITSTVILADSALHHVAITKTGSTVVFYVDGTAYSTVAYLSTFTFGTSIAIGARGDDLSSPFSGTVDELSVYSRALAQGEIQAIYAAGSSGKCITSPPLIVHQPVSETVAAGNNASFTVFATGALPLGYQWQFNSVNINGATTSALSVPNVQAANAGNYSVMVSNPSGSTNSAAAALTVISAGCTPTPFGVVSWWQAEGNANDIVGGNQGAPTGGVTYGTGEVGQAFVFTSGGSAVNLGNPVSLQLQNFTIEAWVQLNAVSSGNDRVILGYGDKGYIFGVRNTGALFLSKAGNDIVVATTGLTDTLYHHVAVTKSGTAVVFYIDGVAYPAPSYNTSYSFGTSAAIGARGDDYSASFNGKIDELAIYNRALATSDIQAIFAASSAGRCTTVLPFVLTQPVSQVASVSGTAIFSVVATPPGVLSYQWTFNSANISGATGSSFSIANVQNANAGSYAVIVSDSVGSVTSLPATLTIVSGSCSPVVPGLVGWWPGEGNTVDIASGNNGLIAGNVTYVPGEVGQAFNFDGSGGSGVTLGNPTALQLQNFTIEAWVQLAAVTAGGDRNIFGYGDSGYVFGIRSSGTPYLSKVGNDLATASVSLTDTGVHHVAVTKNGSTLVFYVDGVPYLAPAYTSIFSFGTAIAIGARGDNLSGNFNGKLDEVSVYNRALTTVEIQSIFGAGSAGKCSSAAPVIISQPASRSVVAGQTASFSVSAASLGLTSYQWQFGGANVSGATTSALTLNGVQAANAGNYTVIVANSAGSVTSAPAVLSISPAVCSPAPSGLVSWWEAEGNALDFVSGLNGTVAGTVAYAGGVVGQAFNFTGASGSGLRLPNNAAFQTQTFTIEGWIQLAAVTAVNDRNIFGYGDQGYIFGIRSSGTPFLSRAGADLVSPNFSFTDTAFHHVALTKTGSSVIFYVDGTAYPAPAYTSLFAFGTTPAIGARGDDLSGNFNGKIDELSFYSRALTAAEVQAIYSASLAGKCAPAPTIVTQPVSQAVVVNSPVTFSVGASGAVPLSYQWKFGTNIINGATASSFTLPSAQFNQAGSYSVIVANGGGAVTSSSAVLTVTPPPSTVQMVNVTATSALITLPLNLLAQGTENAVGFSVNFDPTLLTFTGVNLGAGATGASMFVNTNQAGTGKLGLALAQPAGSTFAAGTGELVEITFLAVAKTNANVVAITFGDQPTLRQVSDAFANILPSAFTAGNVTIPFLGIEGDVSPLPAGDNNVTIIDWVQAGRFVAGLDTITDPGVFQRMDCAPRATLGDGVLNVADWVQVGRYAVGLDPLTAGGGPTSAGGPAPMSLGGGGTPSLAGLSSRTVTVISTNGTRGQVCQVSIQLNSQGDENALGYSVNFDATALTFTGATLGGGATGATMNVNTNQATAGTVGLALALPIGSVFAASNHEVVKLKFLVSPNAKGSTAITFSSTPVVQAVASASADTLATTYVPGTLTLTTLVSPSLMITQTNGNILLTWPASATGFNLESTTGFGSSNWTGVALTPVTNLVASNITVTLPPAGTRQYYRLHHP